MFSSRPGKDPWARICGPEPAVLNSQLLAFEAFSSPEQLKIMLMIMIITVIITTITIKALSFGGGRGVRRKESIFFLSTLGGPLRMLSH